MEMNRRNRTMILLAMVVSLLALNGCLAVAVLVTNYNVDVTDNSKFWGGYKPGKVYTLVTDHYIAPSVAPGVDFNLGTGRYNRPVLTTTEEGRRFKKLNEEYGEHGGLVPAGSRIRIAQFKNWGNAVTGSSVRVFAEIMDGHYRGVIVNIDYISCEMDETLKNGMPLYGPCPSHFAAVAEPDDPA